MSIWHPVPQWKLTTLDCESRRQVAMSNSQIVEPPEKKSKANSTIFFMFFHVFHDFHGVLFHGAHMRRRVWCLTATKIWPTTGNITAWQENVTWFDKRKLWRLETKHYVFPTKHNDDVLHMLNKRNVHFDHNNGWFVHFDQNFGWSANQVWLWIHLVMPLDVDAESLPTFQLFHDEESNIVQHFFQTWYILKYLEIYIENTIFDSKKAFSFCFFSFSCFWFCDLACWARFGILGCEASTAIQVTTKKHTFLSLATSWFPTCWKTSRKTLFIHVDTCLYHTCSPCFCFWLQNQRKTERENSTKPLPRSEGHGRTSWRGHLGWPAPLQHTSKASFRLQINFKKSQVFF